MAEPVQRLRLSSPADLVEAVPYVLGYHPDDSLVAFAMRGPRSRLVFTMRLDLPPTDLPPDGQVSVANAVARYLSHARADDAVLVVYGDTGEVLDGLPHRDLIRCAGQSLAARRIHVKDALYVAAGRWWSYSCDDPTCCPSEGTPVRADGCSPVAAAATYAGLVALPDRAAVERMLEPVGFLAARGMQQAIARIDKQLSVSITESGCVEAVRAESLRLLSAAVDDGAALSDDEAARLLVGLDDIAVRDACCEWACGDRGQRALSLWVQLARRAVPPYDTVPLFLAGWFAWHSGNATLARVAVNRCLATNPAYSFALLLRQALDGAVNPAELAVATPPRRHTRRASR
jgi:hypothetical protein